MKYKQIKSAAHNFAHSFVSSMNSVGDDDVIGHLARAAVACGEPELRVDLLTGDAAPSALLTPPVKSSLEWYIPWLHGLLRSHGANVGAVREATMRVRFGLTRASDDRGFPGNVMLPFECEVEITDDRGIVHVGTVREFVSIRDRAGTSHPA